MAHRFGIPHMCKWQERIQGSMVSYERPLMRCAIACVCYCVGRARNARTHPPVCLVLFINLRAIVVRSNSSIEDHILEWELTRDLIGQEPRIMKPIRSCWITANLPTNIMDFRGFDSSIILILRGGIPRPIGDSSGKFDSSNLNRDNVSREIGINLTSVPQGRGEPGLRERGRVREEANDRCRRSVHA